MEVQDKEIEWQSELRMSPIPSKQESKGFFLLNVFYNLIRR